MSHHRAWCLSFQRITRLIDDSGSSQFLYIRDLDKLDEVGYIDSWEQFIDPYDRYYQYIQTTASVVMVRIDNKHPAPDKDYALSLEYFEGIIKPLSSKAVRGVQSLSNFKHFYSLFPGCTYDIDIDVPNTNRLGAVLDSPGLRTNSPYPKFLNCHYTLRSGSGAFGMWQFISYLEQFNDDSGGVKLGQGDTVTVSILIRWEVKLKQGLYILCVLIRCRIRLKDREKNVRVCNCLLGCGSN